MVSISLTEKQMRIENTPDKEEFNEEIIIEQEDRLDTQMKEKMSEFTKFAQQAYIDVNKRILKRPYSQGHVNAMRPNITNVQNQVIINNNFNFTSDNRDGNHMNIDENYVIPPDHLLNSQLHYYNGAGDFPNEIIDDKYINNDDESNSANLIMLDGEIDNNLVKQAFSIGSSQRNI